MRGQTYVILAIIVVLIVAIFAVINVDPVEVNYLFGTGEAPLILVILFSVLMGGIITAAVGLVKMFRLQRERNALLSDNRQMRAVLENHDLIEETESNSDQTGAPTNNQH